MTWHAKRTGPYYMGSTEADDNARESMAILMNSFGWTFEACCGMFGNIDYEGQWNPWRWEGENVRSRAQAQSDTTYVHGYGLIGWTPAKKYQFNNATDPRSGAIFFPDYNQESYPGYGPNWSDVQGLATDGAAQIRLIGEAMRRGSGNFWVNRKGCTASRYITLTDPGQAAYYWLWNAEYPAQITQQEPLRRRAAWNWYNHLGGGPSAHRKIWLFKRIIDTSNGKLSNY